MGAWIETANSRCKSDAGMLLPLWEHGLKLFWCNGGGTFTQVAPFMGAWIETHAEALVQKFEGVAPFMGAWIETPYGR